MPATTLTKLSWPFVLQKSLTVSICKLSQQDLSLLSMLACALQIWLLTSRLIFTIDLKNVPFVEGSSLLTWVQFTVAAQ